MFSTPGILLNFFLSSSWTISVAEVVLKVSMKNLAKPASVENAITDDCFRQVLIDEILYLNKVLKILLLCLIHIEAHLKFGSYQHTV